MPDNQYQSGLASLFATHARQEPVQTAKQPITKADVTLAFTDAWNCQDGEEFLKLYAKYQTILADYQIQEGQQ